MKMMGTRTKSSMKSLPCSIESFYQRLQEAITLDVYPIVEYSPVLTFRS